MGIIKIRDELISVTCAILKDADRDAFFSQIRKNRAGSPEELARWLGVPVALINYWVGGKIHIPYNTLQSISYQFSVEMPPVGELRRESLPAAQLPSAKPAEPPPEPRARSRERPQRERKAREAPPERPKLQRIRKERPAQKSPAAPREPSGPRSPKPSEALAYWAGILYAAARVEGDTLSFSADRRIGQNFAGIWARKTKELFGVSCSLAMREDGKIQEAKCEIPELGKFLSRFCPGAGLSPRAQSQRAASALGPGADTRTEAVPSPRWIWSNPVWKAAYLKGLADVSARFQRQPTIALDVPSNLKHSVQKLLISLGFKPHEGNAGALIISGREELERYFKSIGTGNMKLRDQWDSYCRGGKEEPGSEPEEQAPQIPASSAAPEAKPAAPAQRRRSGRPRRMVYRGRPGQ